MTLYQTKDRVKIGRRVALNYHVKTIISVYTIQIIGAKKIRGKKFSDISRR